MFAARQRLREASISPVEGDLSARVLAQHALGWDAARYLTSAHEEAPPDFPSAYEALVKRRIAREPVAYITGQKEFWGRSFEVSPSVLIPRPETELIVEAALERLPFNGAAGSLRVADIGTGSGCLAVSIALERPHVSVIASDVSADALAVARRNATNHGVIDHLELVTSDLFDDIEGQFDVIVSNPPYVSERSRAALQPEVRDHEPALAVFARDDGFAMVRRLVCASPTHLKPGGTLIFEFGLDQAEAVDRLIADTPGLRMVELKEDLQGIPRTAIATRI